MDTWETKKQKWYRDTYNQSLQPASDLIEESLDGFSNIQSNYKELHLKKLLTLFFEKKRELEKRCHFCHVEVARENKKPFLCFYELRIDSLLYQDYFGTIETYSVCNSKATIKTVVPGLPLEKASHVLLKKWYDFMNENGYFESLQEFSASLNFVKLFD